MNSLNDELVFNVKPRIDSSSHGAVNYTVNLTALRDGHKGRANVIGFEGSSTFGLRLGLAIKKRLQERRLSKSDAREHKSAANEFMRFFDREALSQDITIDNKLLSRYADSLQSYYGESIPGGIPRIYRCICAVFRVMNPAIRVQRTRFITEAVKSTKAERLGSTNYVAAFTALTDFKRVDERIALGRAESRSSGESLIELVERDENVNAKDCTRSHTLRLLNKQLGLRPITAAQFHERFGLRADQWLTVPAPGRPATPGASSMKTGLAAAFRYVLPTATDLMGPFVLMLECTGWNQATILNMKSSMITNAVATAVNGKSKIESWKGRAKRPETAPVRTDKGLLLDILQSVQEWTSPLRHSLVDQVAGLDRAVLLESDPAVRFDLIRRRDELKNMEDRLWLCMTTATVGISRLGPNDVSAACFRAMFVDNEADLDAIGDYNCHEARLNYMARIDRGHGLDIELLRAHARHAQTTTTSQHYAEKLPVAIRRDRSIAKFNATLFSAKTSASS